MNISNGIKIVEGVALGKLRFYRAPSRETNPAPADDPVYEQVRFESARKTVLAQRRAMKDRVRDSLGGKEAAIFEVHEMLLEDPRFIQKCEDLIMEQRRRADLAVNLVLDSLAQDFREIDDPVFGARSADVQDLKKAMLDVLSGAENEWEHSEVPVIIAAQELTPSQLFNLDRDKLLGIVTQGGSQYSHVAILAKSLNIPTLIGCMDLSRDWDGLDAALDTYEEHLYIEPTAEVKRILIQKQEIERENKLRLCMLKGQGNTTIDGHAVKIWANIGSPQDVAAVLDNDADGIGLFRTEFLYMGRDDEPSEFEQFQAYKSVLEALGPRKVIIRTCDLGSDKLPDYLYHQKEENPALGCRGIRFCLTRRDLFKRQLRAILRASVFGNPGIMLPMVVDVKEIMMTKALIEQCCDELKKDGLEYKVPDMGVMIETPAAALCADELAKESDFFSLGTNDLTQYALAMDRQTPGMERAWDAHNPAVFKLIEMAVKTGHAADIPVGMCGELAADLDVTAKLLQIGVDVLSVDPATVLPLRQHIRGINLEESDTL